MATFEEFMKVAEISLKDKTSHARMNEIVRIMRQYKVLHGLTPAQAVEVLQALGPTYVKIGQLASNRSDLLPKAYCDAFEKLRDDANPMPFDVVIEQTARTGSRGTRCSPPSTPCLWARPPSPRCTRRRCLTARRWR